MAEALCAVITAAYRAPEWVLECVASVAAQEPLGGWRFEHRIGVDGCLETARSLKAAGIPFWWSPANVGPYLIRNALMKAHADAYAVFDADDTMDPHYLRTLLPLMGEGIAGAARIGMDERGRVGAEPTVYPWVSGVSVFSAGAWQKLGGYRPWRIAADFDAIARARILRIPITTCEEALYRRRSHPHSLTQHPDTRIKSPERKNKKRESRRLVRKRELHVTPECAVLEWRGVMEGAA